VRTPFARLRAADKAMEQQREPELTQQRQTVKEGAPFEAAPAHTTQTAGSAEPVGEAPGYGLSDPRTLPQDAPTRGGNLPGETAGSRVPEQQQYEQREQQQEVLPVRHAEQREFAQPQQEQQQQQRVLPAQHEQPVVQQQQPVPVAAEQQRHEEVVEDVASDDEESSSTGEAEPVTHLQRDNAQAIKTKLTEMDNGKFNNCCYSALVDVVRTVKLTDCYCNVSPRYAVIQ
jgi:hypothetical protein